MYSVCCHYVMSCRIYIKMLFICICIVCTVINVEFIIILLIHVQSYFRDCICLGLRLYLVNIVEFKVYNSLFKSISQYTCSKQLILDYLKFAILLQCLKKMCEILCVNGYVTNLFFYALDHVKSGIDGRSSYGIDSYFDNIQK